MRVNRTGSTAAFVRRNRRIARGALFCAAIAALYVGGFVYDELGPKAYAVVIMVVASIPLLLKLHFWKQIVVHVPLLLLRVVAKYLLKVFGKNTLTFLSGRFQPFAQRYASTKRTMVDAREAMLRRWRNTRIATKSYLIIIFAPLAVAVALILLVMELLRLKLVQMMLEKAVTKALDYVPHGLDASVGNSVMEPHRGSGEKTPNAAKFNSKRAESTMRP